MHLTILLRRLDQIEDIEQEVEPGECHEASESDELSTEEFQN